MKISDFPSNLPPEDIISQHYSALSARFKWAMRISIAVLILFIFLMIGFFGDKITYANLRAFIGTIDSDYYFSEDGRAKIERELSSSESVYAYGDGIIILGNNSLKYIKYNGRMLISDNISEFNDPQISLGEDFFILYDRGGTKYCKYSASGIDKAMKSDFSIYGVSISTSGFFAVVSNSDIGNSRVSVYNKRETLVCEYKSERFCLSTQISDDGNDLLIVGLSSDIAEPSHQITLYSIKNKKTVYSLSYDSLAFMSATLLDNSKAAILFEERFLVLDRSGSVKDELKLNSKIAYYSFCHNRAVVVTRDNKINIMAVDSKSDKIYNINVSIPNNICGLVSTEKYIYLCTDKDVFSISGDELRSDRFKFDETIVYIVASEFGCSVITADYVEAILSE